MLIAERKVIARCSADIGIGGPGLIRSAPESMLDQLEAVGSLRDANAADGTSAYCPIMCPLRFLRADREDERSCDAGAGDEQDFWCHCSILDGGLV